MSLVGSSVQRVEDPRLLRGGGRYIDDIDLPDLLHAAFVRSPYPHARVVSIDKAAALAVPGVRHVVTFADLPAELARPLPLLVPNPAIKAPRTHSPLADGHVRFAGEAVAIVLADDPYCAEDGAEALEVDYDPMPAAGDCKAALAANAPRAHADLDSNLAARWTLGYGDPDAAFARAAHTVSVSLFAHRGGGHAIENRAVMARHDPATGDFTIWANTQTPHQLRDAFAMMYGVNESAVRVIAPGDVGGGFGPKGLLYPEQIAIPAAAEIAGRPVKWLEDRRENFLSCHQERDQYWELEGAFAADGTLLGVRGGLVHDSGAYMPWGVISPYISAATVPGPYVLPAYALDIQAVYTNKISVTPVRGAGRPQACFAMERLMDKAADTLGLDPAEIRFRNLIPADRMPYPVGLTFRDGKPVRYDSGDYPACQRKALEASDYAGFPARQAAARSDGRHIGIGIANYVEGTGLGPFEGVTVRVMRNGKIQVLTGAAPQGQGHQTMLAQIVADELGADIAAISVATGDTRDVAKGIGTFASRVAANAGPSARQSAGKVREKILKIAAHLLEATEADLELRDGRAVLKDAPEHGKTFAEIAGFTAGMPGFSLPDTLDINLEDTAFFTPQQATYANGSHVVEVEVDVETGGVRILRYTAAHDCGTIIHPQSVDGQVIGGIAHGIGNALYEWMRYDENANPLTATFADYLLPTAPEVPEPTLVHQQTPSPVNPLGVKGAGEGGTIPAAAAIAAAVENALKDLGVRITATPITPPDLLALIDDARRSR